MYSHSLFAKRVCYREGHLVQSHSLFTKCNRKTYSQNVFTKRIRKAHSHSIFGKRIHKVLGLTREGVMAMAYAIVEKTGQSHPF